MSDVALVRRGTGKRTVAFSARATSGRSQQRERTLHGQWLSFAVACQLLLASSAADAQVAATGKGWLLDAAGSVTSAPSEVISGRGSIKGSYFGSSPFTSFLHSDPLYVRFAPSQTYTVTASYRILAEASGSFDFAINSPTANSVGIFGPGTTIRGPAGATGIATLTGTLQNYSDYRISFAVVGTGAVVLDDIRITDSGGRVIAVENAEGPALASGPLNFRLTDAITVVAPSSASVRSIAVKDLDGDGYPEALVTLSAPPPSNTPLEAIVVEASGSLRLATQEYFPGGAPTVKHSPSTFFADINGDGLTDILFADAGYDGTPAPQAGSVIGIALNLGGGKFRNLSPLVPADLQATRSYAVTAGDLDGDGRVAILLPDEDNGANTALLRWNGTGFDAQRNWISQSLWTGPTKLVNNGWLEVADFDGDGRQDLLVAGTTIPGTPVLRVLFGSPRGFNAAELVTLPDGVFGDLANRWQFPIQETADVGPVLITDLNNDGRPDVFAFVHHTLVYQPGAITDTSEPGYADIRANGGIVYGDAGIQVLLNQGGRRFIDAASASTARNLGRRHYYAMFAVDLNNDGFVDIVASYTSSRYASDRGGQYGTTVFLNDGTGAFQVVEGEQLFGAVTAPSNGQRWSLGSFVPTVVTRERTEGVVIESAGGCGVGGGCPAVRLDLYKISANGALGTGPDFVDPTTLGAPGFNEFYYLRHYADAAAAVRTGQHATGLAHYLAVGKAKGYLPSASASGAPARLNASIVGSNVTLSWDAPSTGAVTSYRLEAGSASGLADLASVGIGSTATTLAFADVPPGRYYVRTRALAGAAMSPPSNEVVVTVGPAPCSAPPAAPSDLAAIVVGSTVSLRWVASSGSLQSYVLEVGSASGLSDFGSLDLGQPATMFAAAGVASGTYYVRVRARSSCGTSRASNEVRVVVPQTAGVRPRSR